MIDGSAWCFSAGAECPVAEEICGGDSEWAGKGFTSRYPTARVTEGQEAPTRRVKTEKPPTLTSAAAGGFLLSIRGRPPKPKDRNYAARALNFDPMEAVAEGLTNLEVYKGSIYYRLSCTLSRYTPAPERSRFVSVDVRMPRELLQQ